MSSWKVRFCKIDDNAMMPTLATDGSVGYDLYALNETEIAPSETKIVETGLVGIPPIGFFFKLYIRSSMPYKNNGLVLANSTGIIDSDYIGPEDQIKIMLLNTKIRGPSYVIKKHQKIAQLVLSKVFVPPIEEVTIEQLKKSRGGIGSSGEF